MHLGGVLIRSIIRSIIRCIINFFRSINQQLMINKAPKVTVTAYEA